MDFGEVLRNAWQITWKHKILWIFGILAGCTQGGGGGGGSGNRVNVPGNAPSGQNPFPQFEQFFTNFGDWIGNHVWVVVLFVLVVIVLVILSIFLGTIGRIGLILGTMKADGPVGGVTGAERLAFGELWAESMPFFWRVFLLSLLLGLASLIVFLPIALVGVAFAALTAGVGLLCLIPLFCIMIPVFWAAGLIVMLAELAMVTEDLQIPDGLRRGWNVFKEHIGPVLIMWLILAVIGVVAGIAISLPILVVIIPAAIAFAGSAAYAGAASRLSYTPLLLAGLCLVAYIPVLIVLKGILSTYLQSAWTLTYLRLARPKEIIDNTPILAPNA